MADPDKTVTDLAVVAGILERPDQRVLIARRPMGKAFAGRWEFPGGKIDPFESPEAALHRELSEELGIEVTTCEPLLTVRHRYPGAARGVEITAFRVRAWLGVPRGLDGQDLAWTAVDELPAADLLEADQPIVTALLLPRHFIKVASVLRDPANWSAVRAPARVGWLFDHSPDARVCDALIARGDMGFRLVAPAGSDRVGSMICELVVPPRLAPLRGAVVCSESAAVEAVSKGAGFLIVRAALPADQYRTLARLGIPWYSVALPDGQPLPTGTVDW